MTTEDDFQKALVAEPMDLHLRRVLSDWLDEHNDPRADGYRVMRVCRVGTLDRRRRAVGLVERPLLRRVEEPRLALLPDDWYDLQPPVRSPERCAVARTVLSEALNDAALAFANLPATRMAELLAVG